MGVISNAILGFTVDRMNELSSNPRWNVGSNKADPPMNPAATCQPIALLTSEKLKHFTIAI
jgi:hypothetical protein